MFSSLMRKKMADLWSTNFKALFYSEMLKCGKHSRGLKDPRHAIPAAHHCTRFGARGWNPGDGRRVRWCPLTSPKCIRFQVELISDMTGSPVLGSRAQGLCVWHKSPQCMLCCHPYRKDRAYAHTNDESICSCEPVEEFLECCFKKKRSTISLSDNDNVGDIAIRTTD